MDINMDWDQFINNALDAIIISDKDGRIVQANVQAAENLHLSLDALIDSTADNLVEQGIYDNSVILKAMREKQVVTDVIRTNDDRYLLSTSIPILDSTGNVNYIITTSHTSELLEHLLLKINSMERCNKSYRKTIEFLNNSNGFMVAESPQMKKIVNYCNNISDFEGNLILFGESGCGKEVVARYLHKISPRNSCPFIPVNCAAIPKDLFESEFFGYAPGAFTGAASKGKVGCFELADKGTLFLDEIGEMPLEMQSKLLRVVETGEVSPLGSTKVIKTNVRIISATNRNLMQMKNDGTFRDDLYYRLSVIPITIPPLRERKDDIFALSYFFLDKINQRTNSHKFLTNESKRTLTEYAWPGNIRELRNVIERFYVLSPGDGIDITLSDLIPPSNSNVQGNSLDEKLFCNMGDFHGSLSEAMAKFQTLYIEAVVKKNHYRLGNTAKELGVNRSTLYRKIKGADQPEEDSSRYCAESDYPSPFRSSKKLI